MENRRWGTNVGGDERHATGPHPASQGHKLDWRTGRLTHPHPIQSTRGRAIPTLHAVTTDRAWVSSDPEIRVLRGRRQAPYPPTAKTARWARPRSIESSSFQAP